MSDRKARRRATHAQKAYKIGNVKQGQDTVLLRQLKRLGKGLLAIAAAWLGGLNEWPAGQYDTRGRGWAG